MFLNRRNSNLRPLLPKTPLPKREAPCTKKCKSSVKKAEDEIYVCKTCLKEFKRKPRYENHLRLHTGESPFICNTCDKHFRCIESLSAHQKIHTDKKAFSCEKCNRQFKTSHELRKHERLTNNAISKDEPNDHCAVKCKLCTYWIISRQAGRLHMYTHRKKKCPYMCSTCKQSFSRITELGRHERKQHRVIPVCPMTLEELASQEDQEISEDGAEKWDCYKCKKNFEDGIEDHQHAGCKQHHVHQIHCYSKPARSYVCHRCGKRSQSSTALGKHLATHFEVDSYRCKSCSCEFQDKEDYENHRCLKMSEVSNKPILVVKFLHVPHNTNQQNIQTPLETVSSSNEGILYETTSRMEQQSTEYQQPTNHDDNQTASETSELQNYREQVENEGINSPIETLASGTRKPIIIVKFQNNNTEQSLRDIQAS